MMADTLVFSQLYALPVWGSSLKANLISHLQCMCNRAVRVICGLHKFDHVSDSRHHLDMLVQYRALVMMYRQYVHRTPTFEPSFEFGTNHLCETRTLPYFCVTGLVWVNVFSVVKQLCGGIVYLLCCLHSLITYSIWIFT